MTFIRPHIKNVIEREIPEDRLKKALWESYDEIDDLKKEMDIVKEIKNSVTDKIINEKLMKLPKFKEIGEALL